MQLGTAYAKNGSIGYIDSSIQSDKKKLSFDSRFPIYLSDKSKYDFSQIHLALDKVFSYKKPVLFFIHGRGNEPSKSLEGGFFTEGNAVHKLEDQYGVKVIMFNWQSSASLYDREEPLSHMTEAAGNLKRVFTELQSYLNLNPNKKISLLAHSMGSIVVQTYFQNYGWNFKYKLFSNFILTSPDADNLNHHLWVEKISSLENVFVTINKDDSILSKSTDARKPGVAALGNTPVSPLASHARYLDLTKMSDRVGKANKSHEIFNKPNMLGQKNLCEVMQSLLSSEIPSLSKATQKTKDSNYLKFVFNIDENTPCFKM